MAGSRGSASGWVAMLLVILLAAAAWALPQVPGPWDQVVRGVLRALRGPALTLGVLLVGGWLVWSALRARNADPETATGGPEEPLLSELPLFQCHSRVPVALVSGLQAGAGATTLVFNLATAMAVHGLAADGGSIRRARPVALLIDGPLSRRLGLSPDALDEYLSEHPYRVGPEVVNLAVRHPTGCELLCLPREGRSWTSIRPLAGELRRHYDCVLLDGGPSDRLLLDAATDLADALLLVALPSAASLDAIGLWIERIFAMDLETKTALVVNRISEANVPPREFDLAFPFGLQLPDEPDAPALDMEGLPWSLDERLHLARRFMVAVRRLFPGLTEVHAGAA